MRQTGILEQLPNLLRKRPMLVFHFANIIVLYPRREASFRVWYPVRVGQRVCGCVPNKPCEAPSLHESERFCHFLRWPRCMPKNLVLVRGIQSVPRVPHKRKGERTTHRFDISRRAWHVRYPAANEDLAFWTSITSLKLMLVLGYVEVVFVHSGGPNFSDWAPQEFRSK